MAIPILDQVIPILQMWQFWAVVTGIAFIGGGLYGMVRKIIPVQKSTLMFIGIGGLIVTSGVLGSTAFGTAGAGSVSAMGFISDLQVTDVGDTNNCTVTANNNIDDLLDVRCNDANVNENAGDLEVNNTKVTVTRTGTLNAMSCPVVASTSRGYQSETTPGDGTLYTITEQTTLGELEVYLTTGTVASPTTVTTSSQKEKASLSFAEGVSQGTINVLMELDEGGHDNLNQYSFKDVVVDVCGKPLTFRVHRMD